MISAKPAADANALPVAELTVAMVLLSGKDVFGLRDRYRHDRTFPLGEVVPGIGNTARGSLVDTEALFAELVTGRISAILDVTEPEPLPANSPLFELPNVFLTPHIAGSQGNELGRLGHAAADEVERLVAGAPLAHQVLATDLDRVA